MRIVHSRCGTHYDMKTKCDSWKHFTVVNLENKCSLYVFGGRKL